MNNSDPIVVSDILDNNFKLVLNKGSNYGISEDDKFLIYQLSDKEIIDPISNKSLGKLEIVKGTGRVVHLQDTMCTILSTNYKTTLLAKTSLFGASTSKNDLLPFENPEIKDLAKRL